MEQEPGNTCPLNLQHTPFFFWTEIHELCAHSDAAANVLVRLSVDIDDREAVGMDVYGAADAGVDVSMHLIDKECGIAQARPAPSHTRSHCACKFACGNGTTCHAQGRGKATEPNMMQGQGFAPQHQEAEKRRGNGGNWGEIREEAAGEDIWLAQKVLQTFAH